MASRQLPCACHYLTSSWGADRLQKDRFVVMASNWIQTGLNLAGYHKSRLQCIDACMRSIYIRMRAITYQACCMIMQSVCFKSFMLQSTFEQHAQ